ncbi:hypothetical protein P8C59_001147 [Phyllachora maydis]|uniref:THIF-type NAD/FAD binding fold domain-containing protein n=1 Tax=Phyllachora maydis TaxID=1825666 RepID=A0AAD9HZ00_9PEZI|nr:hypothetical protein P8C59_001147 [Phyllachora maydis]
MLGGGHVDRTSRAPSPNSQTPLAFTTPTSSHGASLVHGLVKKKPPPPPPKRKPSMRPEEWVVALYSFSGEGEGDLSFREGDRIRIVKKTETDQDCEKGIMSQQPGAHSKLQLAATALASGAVVAGAILGYQRLQKEERLTRLKSSIPEPEEQARAPRSPPHQILEREQLARNRAFLGEAGQARLRAAFVVVVGCGGVGSHCAAALARAGVGRLRLVDFDQVTLSSLNRHAVATRADVGAPKVRCLLRRLRAVAPWVRFDARAEVLDGTSAAALVGPWTGDGDGDDDGDDDGDGDGDGDGGGRGGERQDGRMPDFVVDAIDNIDTKVHLLKHCWDQKLPVISSMGAGTKSDPTKIMVGDIGASTDDGLSRATRRRLKLQGVTAGIPVIFSTEQMGDGKAKLLPLPEDEFQKGSVGDLGVLPDFRARILPVLGTIPAVFGYTAANHVILSITGYPTDYVCGKSRDKMYEGILAYVQGTEEKLMRALEKGAPSEDVALGLKIPITTGDIAFLAEELYGGRSVVTGLPTRLVLTRWRKPETSILVTVGGGETVQRSSDLRLRDLVCMTRDEAKRHFKEVLTGPRTVEELYDARVVEKVEARVKRAQMYEDEFR